MDDEVIMADVALATKLLDDDECPKHNKAFIGVPEDHHGPLTNIPFLAQKIERFLKA